MKLYKTEGLVLSRHPLSESSIIATILSPDAGRFQVVAKGARSIKSSNFGMLEPLNRIELEVYMKEGRELQTLKSASILKNSFALFENKSSSGTLHMVSEALLLWEKEMDPKPAIYRLILLCIEGCGRLPQRVILSYFFYWILRIEGLFPSLDKCSSCKKAANGLYAVEGDGEIYCKECIPSACAWHSDRQFHDRVFHLTKSVLDCIKVLSRKNLLEISALPPFKEAFSVLYSLFTSHLGRGLKSVVMLSDE